MKYLLFTLASDRGCDRIEILFRVCHLPVLKTHYFLRQYDADGSTELTVSNNGNIGRWYQTCNWRNF